MKKIIILLATLALALSSSVYAHTGLVSSSPINNAMLMYSPDNVELTFGKEVRLLKLKLTNKNGRKFVFGFKITGKSATSYSYALPMLPVDTYNVTWVAMGNDAHKINGKIVFMVHVSTKQPSQKVIKTAVEKHKNISIK